MATVGHDNLQKQRFGPSDRLITIFSMCSRNPSEAITARVKHMLQTFQLHHKDTLGRDQTKGIKATDEVLRSTELVSKCCCEAEFWYYRILENLVSLEQNRPGVRNFSGILEAGLFHCCLLTCCLEITTFTNNLSCDLPLLLQTLKMESYHFYGVVELVLRAEVGLPQPVVRHLSQVEEKVLETLAWSSNSPLWEEIRANEGLLPTCQQVMSVAQLEDPKSSDLQTEPKLKEAVSRPQRSRPLHLFARKVYNLLSVRLRELCSRLDVCDDLRVKIWTCLEYSLVHCTQLMVNRHLDQLLMCAIYIIAKVTMVEIPFKLIMTRYSVCKNVLISEPNTDSAPNNHGVPSDGILTPNSPSSHHPGESEENIDDLIYFYNHVYRTKMQHFAETFALSSGGETPPLSPYPRQRTSSPRRQHLSRSPSVYVSLYNPESSPSSRGVCYYFNESPPERLREINNMVKTGKAAASRRHAEEDGPPAKRLQLDTPSAWHRRLMDVANNRVTRGIPEETSTAGKSELP